MYVVCPHCKGNKIERMQASIDMMIDNQRFPNYESCICRGYGVVKILSLTKDDLAIDYVYEMVLETNKGGF